MSFRDFSFTVYTTPGVEEECLCLQDDHGVDVNILLFCAYAAVVAGITLSEPDLIEIESEVEALRDGVIVPLRTCRRALKQGIARLYPETVLEAQQLRDRVKELELAAEHLEQDSLTAWLSASGRSGRGAPLTPNDNIGLLLSRYRRGDSEPPFTENLARAALACA